MSADLLPLNPTLYDDCWCGASLSAMLAGPFPLQARFLLIKYRLKRDAYKPDGTLTDVPFNQTCLLKSDMSADPVPVPQSDMYFCRVQLYHAGIIYSDKSSSGKTSCLLYIHQTCMSADRVLLPRVC